MPKKKTRTDYAPHIREDQAPRCEAAGCKEAGTYKAPADKHKLDEYRWLCLEHIREYNRKWDYFAGMSRDEIEHFMRDAVTGHRPTWMREGNPVKRSEQLQDALYEFMRGVKKPRQPAAPVSAKLRKALAAMDMEHPYTLTSLKSQYRRMVKKFHPDAHKGSQKHEERFKEITASYHVLTEHLKSQK